MSDFRRWFLAAAALSLSTNVADAQGQYLISTYAGGLANPTAAPGLNFAFEYPNAVATDPFGNTYISTQYNCVFRLDASRNLSRVAGNCQTGFSGDGGSALNAQLNNPQGLALDTLGNLYIADQYNQRIRMVTPGGIISTVAGTGTAGSLGDNSLAVSAELNNPQGVAVDAAGNIYIADMGNYRIRKVAAPSGIITTVAGSSAQGTSGDGGPASEASFISPVAVALDSQGDLYISDSTACEVRMINPAGTIVRIAGTPNTPGFSGDSQQAISATLAYPEGIVVGAAGNLYIADRQNYRVRVVAPGGIISTYAGNGIFGYSGDGGPATSAELFSPFGVAADYSGNVYIADTSGVVRVVNTSGTINTVAGNGDAPLPFSGDGGPADLAEFATPWGLARDTAGNLYVADWKGGRIRQIATTGVISTFAGNGSSPDSGDGGPATQASVSAKQVAVDSKGNVYLADLTTIREIADPTGTISTIAGTNGVTGNSPDGTLAVNALLGNYLAGLAVDSNQNVYFSDLNNQRVRMITHATGIISTVAGNGTSGPPTNGLATSSELNDPEGLALDVNGNLYIADNGNCVVRRVSGGTISTVAGNGTCGSTGDSQAATSAELYYPSAVVLDGNGNLYIATADNRIRKVSGGIITTIAGTGTAGYFGDGGPATSAQLNNPEGLTVDSAGNIYVGDFGNSAVRVLQPLQPLTEPLLTVLSIHSGIFPENSTGTFTITASNAAQAAATNGTAVTVTATLPANLTPVAMGGSGWSCSISSLPYSCQNTGSIAGNHSFSPITLTVNTHGGPTQVTNQVTVSGGGSLGSAAEDAAFIGSGTPVLEVSATHAGNFVAGQQDTFTITVGNQISAVDTSGTVKVIDTLPSGLSLVSMVGGSDWNCTVTTATCQTSLPLAGGATYSPIVGTVNVASNAGSPLTNTATVYVGSTAQATSTDTIVVVSLSACEITGGTSVTVSDVQTIINQGLGKSKANNDVNQDGVVNVVDIQIVMNAALYNTCTP